MILAGDVGGTKCNLALFSKKNDKLEIVYRQRFASKDFSTFDLIVKEFSRHAGPYLGNGKIEAAGFGIAGPVVNNRIHATNLPWVIDADTLAEDLKVKPIVLMNDLGAWGHSIDHLATEEMVLLNAGKPYPGGTRALIAAGTGLGQSILFWDGVRYRVVASEGGHSDFAPRTPQQIELLKFMSRRYPQVSWELILSGRGFRTIHEFLAPDGETSCFRGSGRGSCAVYHQERAGEDLSHLRANFGSLDRALWSGSRQPGTESTLAGRDVCGGRDRDKDPAQDEGRIVRRGVQRQMAFHNLAR